MVTEVHEDRKLRKLIHTTHYKFNVGRQYAYQTVHNMKVNGFNVKVHKCMDKHRKIVPCANINTGMEYDRALVGEIVKELPAFFHKHTLYYKMFMTLKLYYLH